MDRKYVLVLAVAAATILVAGSLVRPQPKPSPPPVPATPAPTPPLSRRGQMRQISDFLADRVADSARHVVFVPETGASGVVFDAQTVITSSATHAPVHVAMETPPPEVPPVRLASQEQISRPGAWALVVGRSADGDTISASGILGGAAEAPCGGERIRKLLLNVPLDATFAGAGLFDITGELTGIVGFCDGSWTAIAHPSIMPLLTGQSGSGSLIWRDIGVRVRTPSPQEQQALKLPESGLFVVEVRTGSQAASAGIQPGDMLVGTGEDPLTNPEDLLLPADTLTLVRGGRRITLRANPDYSMEQPRSGPVLTSVKPNSRLHEAGLRSGDSIVRIAGLDYPSTAAVARSLARQEPVWLVYHRNGRAIGVLLP